MNDRVEIAHEFAKAMKSKYVKKMILFGSVARGDDKKDSGLKYMHEDKFNYKIYKYFANAQSDREDADYHAFDGNNQKLAKKRIDKAGEFLEETKKFLK